MGSKSRDYRIANSMAATVSLVVGLIMVLASLQAITEVSGEKQPLLVLLFLSVAVTLTSLVFLIFEIRRSPKEEPTRPGDSEA